MLVADPILYFVTPEIGENVEKWKAIVLQAAYGGVKIVQIRDKRSSAQKMIHIAREIHPFLRNRGVFLLINDRVDIAHAVEADGVHLGQSDLKVAEARAILGRKAIIGLSVETVDQALEAAHEDINYLAASPVFQTRTKTDCAGPWGLNGLKYLCSLSTHPVVAIGGIDATNIEGILACGAAGVAVVSAIVKVPCPKTATQEIVSKMRRYANSRLG